MSDYQKGITAGLALKKRSSFKRWTEHEIEAILLQSRRFTMIPR
jgi:hypothetical protein